MEKAKQTNWKEGDKIGLELLGMNAVGYIYIKPSSDCPGYHIVKDDESDHYLMVLESKILKPFFSK